MPSQKKEPIFITSIGMNERMQNTLRLFFKGACENRCLLVDKERADACIVDLDSYGGHDLYEAHRQQYPGQPCIILSLNKTEIDGVIFLLKPLNRNDVMEALETLIQQLQSKDLKDKLLVPAVKITEPEPASNALVSNKSAMRLNEQETRLLVGTTADIDLLDPEQIKSVMYDTSNFFQGYLQQALAEASSNRRNVDMLTPRGVISIIQNGYYLSIQPTEKQLRSLSRVPLLHGITIKFSDIEGDSVTAKSYKINAASIVWKVTLWAARGRVPIGTDLERPIYLKHWPNMTRLTIFPYAMRIAALWVNQPCSLLDTANMLNIPQRYVFSFYSATHALGLSATSQRSSDRWVQPQLTQQHQKHSLFSRILATLRR